MGISVTLRAKNYQELLNVERYKRLYMLSDVRRLNWGYSAKLRLGKISFPVLIKTGKGGIHILEETGKFRVSLVFNDHETLEVNVNVESSNELIRSSLEEGITRNLKEYAESICNKSEKENTDISSLVFMMKPLVRRVLDVRGEECPVPEIAAKKELSKMRPGEELEILVDHPAAVNITLPEVARLMKCRYEIYNMGDYVSFVMLKLGDPSIDEMYELGLTKWELIPQLIKDIGFIAFLYSKFDRIVKQVPIEELREDHFRFEGLTCVSSASIGGKWLAVGLVSDEKILGLMLDINGQRLFNEEARAKLGKIKGLGHVFYLKST